MKITEFKKLIKEEVRKVVKENNSLTFDRIQQYIMGGGKGNLDLNNLSITSLPDNLRVRGTLDLANNPITTLPDDLWVSVDLILINTKITSLPKGLEVGGNLYLSNTPISKEYSKYELDKMVPGVKKGVIPYNETF